MPILTSSRLRYRMPSKNQLLIGEDTDLLCLLLHHTKDDHQIYLTTEEKPNMERPKVWDIRYVKAKWWRGMASHQQQVSQVMLPLRLYTHVLLQEALNLQMYTGPFPEVAAVYEISYELMRTFSKDVRHFDLHSRFYSYSPIWML